MQHALWPQNRAVCVRVTSLKHAQALMRLLHHVPKNVQRACASALIAAAREFSSTPKLAVILIVTQEAFWKYWLKQAQGLVLLPDAQEGESVKWTEQERVAAYKACNTERSIHSNVVRWQHMFTASNFLESCELCATPSPCALGTSCMKGGHPDACLCSRDSL